MIVYVDADPKSSIAHPSTTLITLAAISWQRHHVASCCPLACCLYPIQQIRRGSKAPSLCKPRAQFVGNEIRQRWTTLPWPSVHFYVTKPVLRKRRFPRRAWRFSSVRNVNISRKRRAQVLPHQPAVTCRGVRRMVDCFREKDGDIASCSEAGRNLHHHKSSCVLPKV